MARSYPLATTRQSDYSWMRSWQVEYAIDRLKRREFIIPSRVGTNPTRCFLMRRWFLSSHSPDQFLDFPVILVLLGGQTAPGLAFLRRLHWLITPDPSSEKDVGRLLDAASGSGTNVGRDVALHVALSWPCHDAGGG